VNPKAMDSIAASRCHRDDKILLIFHGLKRLTKHVDVCPDF
jgi:hypothetical protein